MLNNTLDISKLEEGKAEFNSLFHTINSVVDTVLSVAKSSASKKSIKLNAHYSSAMPQLVEIDKTRFTQVIVNLVGNAIKFTPENGKIEVSAKWLWNCGRNQGNCEECKGYCDGTKKVQEEKLVDEIEDIGTVRNENLCGLLKKMATEKKLFPVSLDKVIAEEEQKENFEEDNYSNGTEEHTLKSTEDIRDKIKPYTFPAKFQNFARSGSAANTVRTSPLHKDYVDLQSFSAMSHISQSRKNSVDLRKNVLEKSLHKSTFESKRSSSIKQPDKHKVIPKSVLVLKNLKKSLWKSAKFGKLSPRSLKKPRAVPSDSLPQAPLLIRPRLVQDESPKSITKIRKIVSCRGLSMKNLKISKENNTTGYFCKYLMEPPKDGILELIVKDTGCGMLPEDQERLFKPFSQANKGVHSKYGGTGLGLWLSHKLITAMKGTIQCESEVGVGTAFIIRIPTRCKTGKNALNADFRTSITCFQKLTVACFVKNPDELQMHLSSLGCRTIICSSFEDLIEFLKNNRSISDKVIMTNRQSAKQAKKISKIESLGLNSSQIVIVTGKLHASCNNFQYILKRPISPHILMDILKHIIHGQTLRSEDCPALVRSPAISACNSRKDSACDFIGNVLVVDDEELVRTVVIRQITKFTDKVTGHECAIKALEDYKNAKEKYKVVFLDYQMPKMNGLELTEQIRMYEKSIGLPKAFIVLLTGDDKRKVQEKATKAGVDLVCIFYCLSEPGTKPLNTNTINEILYDANKDNCIRKQKQREVLSKFAS